LKPVIVAVHAQPEQALKNTVQRFAELGRGAGISVMASIQGDLPDSLQGVYHRFGSAVALQIVDRRVFHDPKVLDGWHHLPVLRSEGCYEHIRHRLETALEELRGAGRVEDGAYREARGLPPRSADPGLDPSPRGGDEEAGHGRGRAAENREEALLARPPRLTPKERLRLRSDEVAARLAAERKQARLAEDARKQRSKPKPPAKPKPSKERARNRDPDRER
jgi:hypothetical protein